MLTALSTAVGVFMTPLLVLVLLGARLPVNAPQMAVSIFQIVVAPVVAGEQRWLTLELHRNSTGLHGCYALSQVSLPMSYPTVSTRLRTRV